MTRPTPTQLTSLLQALQVAHHSGEPLKRWVLCRGSQGFISVSPSERASHLAVRAAAGRSLARQLEQGEAELFYSLGMTRKSAADPFIAAYPASTEGERHTLSQLIEQLMDRTYLKAGEQATLKLYEMEVPELSGAPLLDAMKRVSQERSHQARQRLYWAFVKGRLLLSLKGEPRREAIGPLTQPEELAQALSAYELEDYSSITGYSSAAVFSTWEGALRCHPDGRLLVEVKGRALLPLLLARGVGSLLINPRGTVGGELYRNELTSMEEAMTEWERR